MSGVSPSPARWWVCGLLLAATTINYLDRVALNQSASDIKKAFTINDEGYAWLESGFQLSFAAGALGFGFLVDRFGIRSMYVVAVVGWSMAGLLTGFVDSYLMLLMCRISLGFFEAGNWPCGIRTVKQVMPAEERSLGNAFFQSGTGIGAMLTPIIIAACAAYSLNTGDDNGWRLPFRVIGAIGFLWVLAWVFTVPKGLLQGSVTPDSTTESLPFSAILQDRRFWILAIVIIGVNTTWHTFRVWLPLFMETQLSYSKSEMQTWSFAYYAIADLGSWLIGGFVILQTRRGIGLYRARMTAFAIGVLLALASVGLLWQEPLGRVGAMVFVLVTGFGALGLFATYFALSQEISAKHQGKITGTLGCINSLFLAGIYPIQAMISTEQKGAYHQVLACACVPAVLAFLVTWAFWPSRQHDGSTMK
ncbi:MAG: MFS transporter [Fimbriiglobus sp.]